jgi:hypothetical protein
LTPVPMMISLSVAKAPADTPVIENAIEKTKISEAVRFSIVASPETITVPSYHQAGFSPS